MAHQGHLHLAAHPGQPLAGGGAVGVHQGDAVLAYQRLRPLAQGPVGGQIEAGGLPAQQQREGLDHRLHPEQGGLLCQLLAVAPEQGGKAAAIEVGQQIQQAALAATDPVLAVMHQQNGGCAHDSAPFSCLSRSAPAMAISASLACRTYLMAATASDSSR